MRWVSPVYIAVSFVLVLGVILLQWSQSLIIGADGFLHAQMARDAANHWGIVSGLPQAHFSWFVTRFSDKDFMYHMYLAPFVIALGVNAGAKWGAVVATSVLYITVALVVSKNTNNKYYSLLALVLFLSAQFVRDTLEARPLVIALSFTIVGIYFVIKERVWLVFLLCLVYGMTHLSAWFMPLFALTLAVYGWVVDGRFRFKTPLMAIAGFSLSFLLHPNFPNNVFYFYLNGILVPIYAARTGVLELGAEFFPLSTKEILEFFPLVVGGFIFVAYAFFVGGIKKSKHVMGWSIAVMLLGLMGFVARRNLTQLYPVFIIWLGVVASEFVESMRTFSKFTKIRIVFGAAIIVVGTAGYGLWQTTQALPQMLYADKVYAEHFDYISQVLHQKAKVSSRVFHANWSDSQFLIGMAPEYEYIVTFDPIYMYSYDQNLYALYRQVSFGQTSDPYTVIKNTFGAQYGYVGKNFFSALINQVKSDKRFTLLGEDELGIVFAL